MSGSPYGMIGSGRETLLNVREWSGDTSECLGCPPGYPGVVGGLSLLFRSGRHTLLDYQKLSGALP